MTLNVQSIKPVILNTRDFRCNPHDIRFHDAEDLTSFSNYSLTPHAPGILCQGTVSTLLYEDTTRSPREVQWLDLSDGEPKPAAGKPVIHTQNNDIEDMCFVQYGEESLLVVADTEQGLFAYNTEKDKLEWRVAEYLPGNKRDMTVMGVTTDGRGHLFVVDCDNERIQMFSVSDGQYLGYVVIDARVIRSLKTFPRWVEYPLRFPHGTGWSEATSSLICSSKLYQYSWSLISISVKH